MVRARPTLAVCGWHWFAADFVADVGGLDAIIGQRNAARGSGHQPRAEIVFQQPDVTPERR